ncbi:endonuclease domain-containing protein [Salinarimonas sp.]|uniref:endonuclease domain-containing protein n=1 Tax=Salinarimonas sp. TaxID=2766526 RepID=UPI00391D15D7
MPIEVARALRKRMTPHEARLWVRLREIRKAGYHFRRQVPIASFVVDFACLRARLVVEVDGAQHGCDPVSVGDTAPDAHLRALGFHILRFQNREVAFEMAMVMDTIHARLEAHHRPR